jgi:indolepyruvate decarboxylase
MTTVIDHVLNRLRDIGIADIFGVPGDYSFPVNDAISNHRDIRWVGCSNELNAAYAADGYARIKGVGAVCTTYGVGELSAINGIAGAYAEHLPIFHLVGAPNLAAQMNRRLMHHTLGNGEYGFFRKMSEPVVAAHAVLTPENVAYRNRAANLRSPSITAALSTWRFPRTLPSSRCWQKRSPSPCRRAIPQSLASVVSAIGERIHAAGTACVAAWHSRSPVAGIAPSVLDFIDRSGLPFATMFMAKSVLDERHPSYVGIYDGALMNEDVRQFVEGCDLVIDIGSPMTDFNSGAFTSKLDPEKTIVIGHHRTQVGGKTYHGVEMHHILLALANLSLKRQWRSIAPASLGPVMGKGDDQIDSANLYPRWERFLKQDDILVAETGTASMGLGFAHMPAGATFHNQTLWGSIGWATPASLGVAVAAPGQAHHSRHRRRVAPDDCSGHRTIRPARLKANHLCFEQRRLPDRASALQGSGDRVQRHRPVELQQTSRCIRLR